MAKTMIAGRREDGPFANHCGSHDGARDMPHALSPVILLLDALLVLCCHGPCRLSILRLMQDRVADRFGAAADAPVIESGPFN